MANIQFGAITTTTTTARQDVLNYTPGASSKLKLIVVAGFYTTWSATEANLGTVYIAVNGVDKFEFRIQNTDNDTLAGLVILPFGDGIQFSGTEPVVVEVTPASTTSMRWTATEVYDQ